MAVVVVGKAVMTLPAMVGLLAAGEPVFGCAVGAAVWAADVIAINPCGHSETSSGDGRGCHGLPVAAPFHHTSACWECRPPTATTGQTML